MKPFRPKFNDLYKGEWDYPEYMGVGLSFYGIPNDYKLFLDILMSVSCNPVSSRRILEILEKNETKYVTVMARLDFNDIANQLLSIGVSMKIVPPFDYADPNFIENNSRVDMAVLNVLRGDEQPVPLDEKLHAVFKQRLTDAQRSFEERPHNFGPYDRNYKRTY